MAGSSKVGSALFATIVLLAACGGQVEGGESGSREPAPQSSAQGSGSGGARSGFDTTALGACKLGFQWQEAPERDCPWLAAERCYETKLAACACVCPRSSQHSLCVSGFEDVQNGRTVVTCY